MYINCKFLAINKLYVKDVSICNASERT